MTLEHRAIIDQQVAGYDSAEAKYQNQINQANAKYTEEKNKLIRKHLEKVKYAENKTAKLVKQIRSASDDCLSRTVPDSVVVRVRREQANSNKVIR